MFNLFIYLLLVYNGVSVYGVPEMDSKAPSMQHMVPMGPSDGCDDGKSNLEVDWDHSPVNYSCSGKQIAPDDSTGPEPYCEDIPENYEAPHSCMDDAIEYDDVIPTYGTHRPVWPVYGEYIFAPKQRWLHGMEHGALVMLYHPCADTQEVERLKEIVRNCLRRHIITPYNLLSEDRPFALVAWGCRLEMSYVNPEIVQNFIREKALQGPEAKSENGEFDDGLIHESEIVTDEDDTTLCPQS